MKANEKKCPRCAEVIKKEAVVCKHCGYTYSDEEMAAQAAADKQNAKNGAIGCLGLVVVLAMVAMCSKGADAPSGSEAAENSEFAQGAETNTASIALTSSRPTSDWQYSESRDEMRGSTAKFAQVESENEVDLDFPYGEQRGTIGVRRNRDGLNIYFSVGEGQILCRSYSDSYLSVKFDDGPVQRMGCTGTSDGSSETAFFTNEARMLAGLKKAKRTVIEAEFYRQGRQQFNFNTTGLKWK